MSQRDPAFLFYSKDWIEGTAHMRPEEKGIYADLLAYQHQRGSLPDNIETLARLVRMSVDDFEKVWPEVSKKFTQNGSGIANKKLESVMNERKEKGRKNKLIGTFGYVINKLDLNKAQKKKLRSAFDVNEMLATDTEWNSERLTEWCLNATALIEDGNENGNKVSAKIGMDKPSPEDVQGYYDDLCAKKDWAPDKLFGENFVNWYDSKGWKIGNNPMKNWKSAVNTWLIKDMKKSTDSFLPGQKLKSGYGKKRDY